jgi:methionyl-tRNA formyltransferase
MAKKTVFFCGHHSRYAMAHLQPILSSPQFDVQQIIFASPNRWQKFRETTAPDECFAESVSLKSRIIQRARNLNDRIKYGKNRPGISGIPLKIVDDVNADEMIRHLRALEADVILAASYPQMFSRAVIDSAAELSINFHPSALPRCRGAHPHFWSIAKGEKFGGVTAHLLTECLDAGNIVAQRVFRIDHLNYAQLYDRIVDETPALVSEVAEFVASNHRQTIPQDDSRATFYRNERLVHRRIFWREHTAEQIENLSRTGKAFCFFQGRNQVILSEARAIPENRNLHANVRVEPGTIVDLSGGAMVVKSIDECVEIREVRENGREMSLRKWIGRRGVRIGHQFA